MVRNNLLTKVLGLALALALLMGFGLMAMAEEEASSLWDGDYASFITTAQDVWVEIPSGVPNAASYDVSLWSQGRFWEQIAHQYGITQPGTVELSTRGLLTAGNTYALRVIAFDEDDGIVGYCQRQVTVFSQMPANKTVTVTLSSKTSCVGERGIGITVYAPGAESGMLVVGSDVEHFTGESFEVTPWGFGLEGSYEVYAVVSYPDHTQKTSAKQTVTVSDDLGTVGAFNVTGVPEGSFPANQNLTIHVPPVGNTAAITADNKTNVYYEVFLYDYTADTDVVDHSYKYRPDTGDRAGAVSLIGSGVDVVVPKGDLVPGHIYNCAVYAYAWGYGESYVSRIFVVTGSRDNNLTLTVDGDSEGPLQKECGEEFTVRVTLPEDATAMRCSFGNHYEYMNDWSEWEDEWHDLGYVEFTDHVWGGRSETYYAQAYYGEIPEDTDWEDLDWGSATSNVVAVRGMETTALGLPVFNLSSNSVARGENLIVNVTDLGEGAENVGAYITKLDDPDVYHDDYRFHNGRFSIPTAGMQPGTYDITVDNYAEGRYGSAAHAIFYVTEPADNPPVILSVDSHELLTHQQVRAVVYAQGADAVGFYLTNRNGEETDSDELGGEVFDRRFGGWDDVDTITVHAYARYNVDTDDEYREETTAEVAVIAPRGRLADPVLMQKPMLRFVNNPTGVTFTTDENTGWVNIYLRNRGEGYHIADADIDAAEGEYGYTFNGGCFREPGYYEIGVNTNQEGYASGHAKIFFQVVEEEPTFDSKVKLTVNGEDEHAVLLTNETMSIEVLAPGATAVRMLDHDGDWHYCWADDNPAHFSEDWNDGWPHAFTMYAQACYDDYDLEDPNPDTLNWSSTSNMVLVEVSAPNGRLDAPNAWLESDSVNRGDDLIIHVTPQVLPDEEAITYTASAELRGENDEGEVEWDNRYTFTMDDSTNTITIPTNLLPPGDYQTWVQVNAIGYDQNETSLKFRINGDDADDREIITWSDIDTAETHEEFRVYVYANDADWIDMDVTWSEDPDWRDHRGSDREYGDWGFRYESSGTYTFQPIAHYGDDEVEGEPIQVTVNSLRELDAPQVSVPSSILRGEPLEISIDPVDDAQWYGISLHAIDVYGDWHRIRACEYDSLNKYTFEPELFNSDGDRFVVNVTAHAHGYNSSGVDRYVLVLNDENDVGSSFFAISKTDVMTNEPLAVDICAPGADYIRFCHNSLDNVWRETEGETHLSSHSCGDTGDYNFRAYASYDGGETWCQVGSAITVHVTAENHMDAPTVSVPAQVQAGQNVTVRVSYVEGGGDVEFEVHDVVDDNWVYNETMHYEDGNELVFTIPEDCLEANHAYYIQTITCRDGDSTNWDRAWTRNEFSVTPGGGNASLTVSDNKVLRQQGFTITVNAPGAKAIQVYTGENNWRMYEGSHVEDEFDIYTPGVWQVFARYTTADINWDEVDAGDIHYWNGFNWTGVTNSVTMTVTDTGFQLEAPEYTISDTLLNAGESLTIHIDATQGRDEWYGANAFRWDAEGNEQWTDWYSWNDNDQTIVISDDDLQPGLYTLCVNVEHTGDLPAESRELHFAVVDPDRVLTLPSMLKHIEPYAFENIDAQLVIVPAGVTAIDSRAFNNCTSLYAAVIPDAVKNVDDNAFSGCDANLIFATTY